MSDTSLRLFQPLETAGAPGYWRHGSKVARHGKARHNFLVFFGVAALPAYRSVRSPGGQDIRQNGNTSHRHPLPFPSKEKEKEGEGPPSCQKAGMSCRPVTLLQAMCVPCCAIAYLTGHHRLVFGPRTAPRPCLTNAASMKQPRDSITPSGISLLYEPDGAAAPTAE